MKKKTVILASKSPRRIEILTKEGFDVRLLPANIDEVSKDSNPKDVVMDLALRKALAARNSIEESNFDAPIIAADTVVYLDRIIGKPRDRKDAKDILMKLSGKQHWVYTGVAILFPASYTKTQWDSSVDLPDAARDYQNSEYVFYDEAAVFLKKYTEEDIAEYLDSDEPYDKAGAYGIQGYFSRFIDHIEGDYYNVMGLPISKIVSILSPILEK